MIACLKVYFFNMNFKFISTAQIWSQIDIHDHAIALAFERVCLFGGSRWEGNE